VRGHVAAPVSSSRIALDPSLYSLLPSERLATAKMVKDRARRKLQSRVAHWPDHSPGALNAWLLLVTTKPPSWKDRLLVFTEAPLTLGAPHEGFFYPDPLGFWAEVRHWIVELFRLDEPDWGPTEALSLAALVHLGHEPERLARAEAQCQPRMLLFLDEPAWRVADVEARGHTHVVPDPHRDGQSYEGFWGVTGDGRVVGKSPQHPSTHRLYRREDMEAFLHSAPRVGRAVLPGH
jgi:hypothetical protein